MKGLQGVQSQITFLYYRQIEPVANFYEETMSFELVEDQGWAKIYRAGGTAYVGIVAGEKGFHSPQERNAVLVTLVVDDVAAWYEHLKSQGVRMLSALEHRHEIGIQCFFLQDPGGYTLEVQQFMNPRQAEIFGGADSAC
ncbi:MAG: VOC family protein [Anaerolineae bacterium]|jgi:predicted enzyme related to lactoylglutathione lyase